jgi:hypothetical protein
LVQTGGLFISHKKQAPLLKKMVFCQAKEEEMKKILFNATFILVFFALALPAYSLQFDFNAGITVFTDRNTWESLVGKFVTEDFDSSLNAQYFRSLPGETINKL